MAKTSLNKISLKMFIRLETYFIWIWIDNPWKLREKNKSISLSFLFIFKFNNSLCPQRGSNNIYSEFGILSSFSAKLNIIIIPRIDKIILVLLSIMVKNDWFVFLFIFGASLLLFVSIFKKNSWTKIVIKK